jgi:hypothetical protein
MYCYKWTLCDITLSELKIFDMLYVLFIRYKLYNIQIYTLSLIIIIPV